MNVEIVQEWLNPAPTEKFIRTTEENPCFYITLLQNHYIRYLKVGTAENGIKVRFAQKDYKKYSTVKILYVAELKADKKNHKNVCYHVEDLTRSALREMKGLTFVKNDRFRYFQLPHKIPVYTGMNEYTEITVR